MNYPILVLGINFVFSEPLKRKMLEVMSMSKIEHAFVLGNISRSQKNFWLMKNKKYTAIFSALFQFRLG